MKTFALRVNIDERGSLVDNISKEVMESIKHFFVSKSAPGVVRGNHYHLKKKEFFYVIQGECLAVVEDLMTKKREEKLIKDSDNVLVCMEPEQAHALKNIGSKELILLALVNESLDKENPDTYPYEVIKN
jgi:UDP-2-acetamido-2,6-beta-L-arabino-hexul-4-ose reductase